MWRRFRHDNDDDVPLFVPCRNLRNASQTNSAAMAKSPRPLAKANGGSVGLRSFTKRKLLPHAAEIVARFSQRLRGFTVRL
jgi:hypothetical protein